jgi:hypothetical protein
VEHAKLLQPRRTGGVIKFTFNVGNVVSEPSHRCNPDRTPYHGE